MTTKANSCRGKLLQKILLIVVAFLFVESILYFRNQQHQLSMSAKALQNSDTSTKLLATNSIQVFSSSIWRNTITRSEEKTKLNTVLTTNAIATSTPTNEVYFSSSTETPVTSTTTITRSEENTKLNTVPTTNATATSTPTTKVYFSSSTATPVTSTENPSEAKNQAKIISENKRCLQYLLEKNIVEYYYYPESDEDSLNFTTRGIRTKERLSKEYTKPTLAMLFEPSDKYNESILPTNICSASVRSFMPNMMARDYDLLRNLLKFFKHVASLSGMEYYLNFGSLLGHVRFDKRPIPWDDDFDFSVDYSVLKRFKAIFKRERKFYFREQNTSTFLPEFYMRKDMMKIFDKKQNRIRKYAWTFPFLDLFFYSMPEEETFYDLSDEEMAKMMLRDSIHTSHALNASLKVMLPLKKENFFGVKLKMPADSRLFLQRIGYSKDICAPLGWFHRFERHRHGLSHNTINCSLLEGFYEF